MTATDPQQKSMHFPLMCLVEPTKVKIEKAPGEGEGYAVCFVWASSPRSALAFTADTFVCLDFPEGINHTNRAP